MTKLCEYKGVKIIEVNECVDHIYMLVSISPKLSVAQLMRYLKCKKSLMMGGKRRNYYNFDIAVCGIDTSTDEIVDDVSK